MSNELNFDLSTAHTHFAKDTNGRTWTLLSKEDRSAADDLEMERVANASLYHWSQVGTAIHLQRGEWLLAHVYTVLQYPEAAIRHATRCLEITQEHTDLMKDFDLAYGFEAMARALALAGKKEQAKSFYQQAMEAGEAIKDDEDRSIFNGDFKAGFWYGID